MGWAELVQGHQEPGDRDHVALEQVIRAASRGSELTRQLLAFSRKSVVKSRVVDLAALVSDSARMLDRLVGDHVRLEVGPPPKGLPEAEVDPALLEQVLVNLVVNARDATTGGVVRVQCAVFEDPEGMAPGRHPGFRVRDEGAGMQPWVLERAFEPFFTTKGERGTGLGLATCLGIVQQSGGRLRIDSEPGVGTSVEVVLCAAARRARAPRLKATTRPSRQAVILLVEDDGAVRSLMSTALDMSGHAVIEAADGGQALTWMESGHADLLLTDFGLPDMDGLEVVRRVRKHQPDLPAILASGALQAVPDAPDVPVVRLSKPFRIDELIAAIEGVLASSRRAE